MLKGGAAAQLFLKPPLQRGSRDVDLVTRLDKDHVVGYLAELQAKFDGSGMEVKPYAPKGPVVELPLVTYEVYFEPLTYKAIFGSNGRQDYIKLEVLSEDVEIPTTIVEEKETPALKVRNLRCVTLGALSGDKLTTLASKTTGVLPEEQPKQLYDIDNIVFGNDLTKEDVEQMLQTFDKLSKIELGFKRRKETPIGVLEDIIATLDAFSKADLASGDREIRGLIRDFEGTYVSRKAAVSASGWSARALRVKFLAGLMKLSIEGEMDEAGLADTLARAKRLSGSLEESDRKLQEQLLGYAKGPRELKGKPPSRLFWEVVNASNIEELEKLV